MANNFTARNASGSTVTFSSTDIGAGVEAVNHRVCDATASNFLPTMDAAARAGYVIQTDGTNTMPTMDAVGRAGYTFVTDGTHTMPTGDAAARPVFVQVTNGTQSLPTMDAAARAGFQKITNGTNTAAVDAGLSLQTGIAPLGTPVYATGNGGAQANNVTLTIPSGTGYLDGFDIDGLGATAGSAIAVTITGILGGTLTFSVGIPAGVTTPFTLSKRFNPPLKASGATTNIVVNCPSFGSGNTAASVNAYGHYY